jgi:hypothetical protein
MSLASGRRRVGSIVRTPSAKRRGTGDDFEIPAQVAVVGPIQSILGLIFARGMAVTVELKTGARRMLEYLFAPQVEVASKEIRER